MSSYVHKSSAASERAITVMFKGPALQFSRSLRSGLDNDPEFLAHHALEIFPLMEWHLREAGITLDAPDSHTQMQRLIREIVVRLRSYEKGNI